MVKSNLELRAYYSSFEEPQPPFTLDDDMWNPPPSLDWYEGFVHALSSHAPPLANEIFDIIRALEADEQSYWDEYDNCSSETLPSF